MYIEQNKKKTKVKALKKFTKLTLCKKIENVKVRLKYCRFRSTEH